MANPKPPRDINRVIKFLLTNVIPPEKVAVREALIEIYKTAYYKPPEAQRPCWFDLGRALDETIGDPTGIDWAERVERIMADREEIPADFKELDTADLDRHLFSGT